MADQHLYSPCTCTCTAPVPVPAPVPVRAVTPAEHGVGRALLAVLLVHPAVAVNVAVADVLFVDAAALTAGETCLPETPHRRRSQVTDIRHGGVT